MPSRSVSVASGMAAAATDGVAIMDGEDDRGGRGLQTYSTLTGFALTMNLIIGTGAFGLPFAVIQAGTALSLGCLFLFTSMSCLALSYVMESMARAGGIIDERGMSETDPLLSAQTPKGHYVPHIGFHKIDYALMCKLFGGETAHVAVQICMILYSFGVLWAYAAVFSSSVDTLVFQYVFQSDCNIYLNPTFSCSLGYSIAVCAFASVVVTLSLMDISDQAHIQRYLTAYRFAAFIVMISTCFVAFFYPNQFDEGANAAGIPPYVAPLPTFDLSGFGLIFCTTAVALDVHWNIPDVVQPLADKSHALVMSLTAMMLSAAVYAFIAVVCALEFGNSTLPLVTLNWSHFTGRDGGFGGPHDAATAVQSEYWTMAVKLFIMLFPVLNQISVYPLVCLTIGDNILILLPTSLHQTYSLITLRRFCRLCASLPPIIFALFFGRLDSIFQFTGIFAFALVFIVPAALQIASSRYCIKMYGEGADATVFSSFASHPVLVYSVMLCGIGSIIFSLINLVI